MIGEPWFWRDQSLTSRVIATALTPAAWTYDAAQKMRWRLTQPQTVDVPVICVGNATLGGVGKTPFALLLYDLLKQTGRRPWFLTRGYGGSEPGPIKISSNAHSAVQIGDEALLLHKKGPTIVSKNRPAGARFAQKHGAEIILMDDGFQNPSLSKTASVLLLDAEADDVNHRIFPAGPLREPIARAKARAQIIVNIWRNRKNAEAHGFGLHAWLEPVNTPPPQKIIAFSGIGVPDKFFTTLADAGFEIAQKVSFPDHHRFTAQELTALKQLANKEKTALITTEKDFARLPADDQEGILTLPVAMRVNKPEQLIETLSTLIDA